MSNVVVFPLFAREGIVNPTAGRPEPLYFYDADRGTFRPKQGAAFDGGWRWFEPADIDIITIYNKMLDPRAFADITHLELVDSCIGPEFVLFCAKSRCVVEHNYYSASWSVQEKIRAMFARARRELFA